MTKHSNAYKISIILPSYQPSILAPILKYNTIDYPNLLLDNFEKDISPKKLNNGKEEIKSADIMGNDNENSRSADINQ